MRIVILGAPGAGKRAQTALMAEKYGLISLTTSELVKKVMAEEGGHGPQLRMLQQAGQPVPEDLLLTLLQERLQQPDMRDGFILNGFPRNLLQALTLDEALAELDQPLDMVLFIQIETDALMERLVGRRTCRSCGATFNIYTNPPVVDDICDLCGGRLHQRADDNEETVSTRLHVFDHLTAALLDHYGKQGKVVRVDGDDQAKQVFGRTSREVEKFLKQRKAAKTDTPQREETTHAPEVIENKVVSQPASKPQPKVKAPSGTRKTSSTSPTAVQKSEAKAQTKKKPATAKKVSKPLARTSGKSTQATAGKTSGTKPGVKKTLKKKKVTAKISKSKKKVVSKSVKRKAASVKKKTKTKTAKATSVKKRLVAKKVLSKKSVSKKKSVKSKASVKKKAVLKKNSKRPVAKKKRVAKPAKKVARTSSVAVKKQKKAVTGKKKPVKKPVTKSKKKVVTQKKVTKKTHKKRVTLPKTAAKKSTKKKVAKKVAAKKRAVKKKTTKRPSRR
ncbi:MAG: nucleoside monophosphate kinase [Candidatus Thiodiazotropha sp. (ex Myrtea sp. 'scaly one' KF741663)]|nr:nucleoside monophosphate kinase [Candidatus Thiodiazotropha sp. (ex Myrtea sp. 'scaly one' KF741663)]